MARPAIFVFQPYDKASIAALQTATSLAINGTYANLGAGSQWAYATLSGFQRCVTLSCAGDLSAVNVTIAGSTYSGQAVSQTISGPSGGTVSSSTQFMRVDTITGDATMTSIEAGFGNVGQSRPFRPNPYNTPAELAMQVTVVGTIAYGVRSTLDRIENPGATNWVNHPTLSGTATRQDNYAFPPSAVQINTTSAIGGSLVFSINPTGR